MRAGDLIDADAEATSFLLKISSQDGRLVVGLEGDVRLGDGAIRILHGRESIGVVRETQVTLFTFTRSAVPLYVSEFHGVVFLSNNVLWIGRKLGHLRISRRQLIAAGSHESRGSFWRLFEEIRLLYPGSSYLVDADMGRLQVKWLGFDFDPRPDAVSRGQFLEFLLEEYRAHYCDYDTVCLALSGGYDSRLELGLLRHLKKRVHCFHYDLGSSERYLAERVANFGGASFRWFNQKDAARSGMAVFERMRYIRRYDGFFGLSLIPSLGLAEVMAKTFPDAACLMLQTEPYKGRYYGEEEDRTTAWYRHNVIFKRPPLSELESVVEYNRFVEAEIAQIVSASSSYAKHDLRVDAEYNILHSGCARVGARVAPMYENGMPVLSGIRRTRELFSSLPVHERREEAFIQYALGRIAPGMREIPVIHSGMPRLERVFGRAAKWKVLAGTLKRIDRRGRYQNGNFWNAEERVERVFEEHVEMEACLRLGGAIPIKRYFIGRIIAELEDVGGCNVEIC